MSIFSDILSSMQDPKLRHAAIVHLPIGLSIIGPGAALAALAFHRHRKTLRWVTPAIYLLFAAVAFAAAQAGEQAVTGVGTLSANARAVLNQHTQLAGSLWLGALATGVVALGVFATHRRVQLASACGALAFAGGVAAWAGAVGHYGGTAVHVYGVNAPRVLLPAPADSARDPRAAYFRASVAPILEANCVFCHAPAPDSASGLDLTSAAGLLKGGDGGAVVVPGDPEMSVLFQAVSWKHAKLRMPKGGPKLTAAQLDVLSNWIKDGCVWEQGDAPSKP